MSRSDARRTKRIPKFCREAIKRSEKPGVTQAQVAQELGISAQQIANWKRQFNRLSDKQFNTVGGVDYSKVKYAITNVSDYLPWRDFSADKAHQ